MMLSQLRLYNYRNYEDMVVNFKDGIHVIAGKNAQGKTNLLEAILYLSTTRSHRTNNDFDLIREGESSFLIKGSIQKENRKEDVRITVNEKGKNLFIYQNPIIKVSDFIGEFNAVMFCPDDMSLFNTSPKVRRRFIDMELSKVSKKYVNTLYVASKLLKERNSYLKQEHIDDSYLDVLSDQLIDVQVVIMKQRYYFLKELIEKSSPFYQELSNDHTEIDVIYESCIPFQDDENILKEELKKKYQKQKQRDIFMKQTTIGIHKEDFIFELNGKNIATYASQGQKRSVLLALKIGMVHMIYEIIKEYPVLLLDDVFSELDSFRREKLLASLPQEVQIFISATDVNEAVMISKNRMVTLWKVTQGHMEMSGG